MVVTPQRFQISVVVPRVCMGRMSFETSPVIRLAILLSGLLELFHGAIEIVVELEELGRTRIVARPLLETFELLCAKLACGFHGFRCHVRATSYRETDTETTWREWGPERKLTCATRRTTHVSRLRLALLVGVGKFDKGLHGLVVGLRIAECGG